MTDSTTKPWFLKLSSFAGITLLATHYYAELVDPAGIKSRCSFKLNEEQAQRLSTDDFAYQPGWESERYFTRREAIEGGIAGFRASATCPSVLLLGETIYEPTLVVDALGIEPWRVAVLNDLYAEAEKGGWYEGVNGEHMMKRLSKAFGDELAELGLSL